MACSLMPFSVSLPHPASCKVLDVGCDHNRKKKPCVPDRERNTAQRKLCVTVNQISTCPHLSTHIHAVIQIESSVWIEWCKLYAFTRVSFWYLFLSLLVLFISFQIRHESRKTINRAIGPLASPRHIWLALHMFCGWRHNRPRSALVD